MKHFGIDFGTTNTGAYLIEPGIAERRFGDGYGAPLPSIVAIDQSSFEVLVGRTAWERRFELKARGDFEVVRSVKPHLDHPGRCWRGFRRQWDVTAVVRQILRTVVETVKVTSGAELTAATFSIPVGLSAEARRTLRKAAAAVGIRVNTFVKEPTAAIISEWRRVKGSQNVAVFDWGGGTLDVSVVQIQGSRLVELATSGRPEAGNAIDEEIARHVHALIMKSRATPRALCEILPKAYDDLLIRCENAKCKLSESAVAQFQLLDYDGRLEEITLTRASLAPLLEPIVTRAVDTLLATIRKAGIPEESLDYLIVTGGCSKLWQFQERLARHDLFSRVLWAREPEWAIARGAALLDENPGAFEIGEHVALELSDGSFHDVFQPGDRAGSARTLTVALTEDVRSANILYHSRRNGSTNRILDLSVPVMGFELEDIHLDMNLTEDLTLRVAARSERLTEPDSSVAETPELQFSYHLTESMR